MRRFSFYLGIAAICFYGCCKKEPTPAEAALPPATQTGANTFGCKIDGKIFVPEKKGLVPGAPDILESGIPGYPNYVLYIIARRTGNDVQFPGDIHVKIEKIKSLGTYKLGYLGGTTKDLHNYVEVSLSQGIYETDSLNGGELVITRLDTVNSIASGTFNFNAVNKNGNITKVTEGRFDLKQQ